MLPKIALVKKAVESLYQDTAVIHTQESVQDATTGIVTLKSTESEPIPCRLSYSQFPAVDNDGVPHLSQSVKLFVSPDVQVTPGADIDVTHLDEVLYFKCASVDASYQSHTEINLTNREVI